jgi:hypothetical protein
VYLEEMDAEKVVVRVTATAMRPSDGPRLASEVLEALVPYASRGDDPAGNAG